MVRPNLFIAIVIAGLLGVGFRYLPQEKTSRPEKSQLSESVDQQKDTYSCPMHPEVTSAKPGKCPECGMELEKKESSDSQEPRTMGMGSMCAEMCEMMMKDPSMMKMMHECMMGEMKDMKEDDAMRMKAMEKMKSCCGMMKNN